MILININGENILSNNKLNSNNQKLIKKCKKVLTDKI